MSDPINIGHSVIGDMIIDAKCNRWRVTEIDKLGYRWCSRKAGKRNRQIQKFFPEGPALMTPCHPAVRVVKARTRAVKSNPAALAVLNQPGEGLRAERRIRELIVAAHTLTLIDHANQYPPVTVCVEDLQALLRLLDQARLQYKSKEL